MLLVYRSVMSGTFWDFRGVGGLKRLFFFGGGKFRSFLGGSKVLPFWMEFLGLMESEVEKTKGAKWRKPPNHWDLLKVAAKKRHIFRHIPSMVIQSDFFGMAICDPSKGLSDLQLGDEKGTNWITWLMAVSWWFTMVENNKNHQQNKQNSTTPNLPGMQFLQRIFPTNQGWKMERYHFLGNKTQETPGWGHLPHDRYHICSSSS